ncbi:MAG: hypothetical protein ACOCT9_02175 [archaeon]
MTKSYTLYDFLKDNKIEMRIDDEDIYAVIPIYWIENFIGACETEEYFYDFETGYEVILLGDCIIIKLNDILEALNEDLEKYIKLGGGNDG